VARLAGTQVLLPRLRPRPERARRAQAALEELGGAWLKLGQALALRFDLLPADYCLQFFQLLNQVRPFPATEVRATLEAELGRKVEEAFASFDWAPVAAASIGQVHRAVLPDGTPVAVKAQRPGIEGLIHSDLRLMRWLATLVDWASPFGRTRAREMVDELARWTEEELDYRMEARHAVVLRRNAQGDPHERNPRVFAACTTRRVLTLEYLDGVPLVEMLAARRAGDEARLRALAERGHDARRIASHVVWNALNQIYRFGYFHADPHPANLIVLPGDAIGYVDFGIVGKLDEEATGALRYFAQSLFAGRTGAAVEQFFRFLTPSARTDVAAARRDLADTLNDYVESARVGPEGLALSEDIFEIEMLAVVRRHHMALAPEAVRYLKAVLTAEAMVKELDPGFDLREHENRFFGRLMAIEAQECLRPGNIGQALLDARFRVGRALDSLEGVRAAPERLLAVTRSVRRRVQVLTALTLAGWGAVLALVWSSPALPARTLLGFPVRALLLGGVAAILALIVASLLQVRRLPAQGDAGHMGPYPRRMR
jgi:predicted unusual protein kinase regulating ubiquinone biosynthesis (AarF/ABC1/UbiB family)